MPLRSFHRLSQRLPFEAGEEGDRPLAVDAVDDARTAPLLDPDEVTEFDQSPVTRPDVESAQVVRIPSFFRIETDPQIVAFSPGLILVFGHLGFAAHEEVDRLGDGRHVHPQVGRLVPVDEDLEFRLAQLEGGVDIHDPRHLWRTRPRSASCRPESP